MKKVIAILAMCWLLMGTAWNTQYGLIYTNESVRKFCPACQKEGLKSKVYIGGCSSTAMWCGSGHYDEDGNYHPPQECNSTSCDLECSNGHRWRD